MHRHLPACLEAPATCSGIAIGVNSPGLPKTRVILGAVGPGGRRRASRKTNRNRSRTVGARNSEPIQGVVPQGIRLRASDLTLRHDQARRHAVLVERPRMHCPWKCCPPRACSRESAWSGPLNLSLHSCNAREDPTAGAQLRSLLVPDDWGRWPNGTGDSPGGAHHPRRQRDLARAPRAPAHAQPRVRAHLRRHRCEMYLLVLGKAISGLDAFQ
jgi:hypothetical protein